MLNILFITFIGVLLGFILNIFYGLHPNNVIPILSNLFNNPILFVVLIVSLSISYTFFSFIPAVLFNIADINTFPSIDLARKLLHKIGHKNILLLTLYGSLLSSLFTILLVPFMFHVSQFILALYNNILNSLPILLIFFSLMVIYKSNNKIVSSVFLLLSGVLGYLSLNLNIPSSAKLTALLTGIFGLPYIIVDTFYNKEKRAVIQEKNLDITVESLFKGAIFGILSSLVISLIPALTPIHGFILLSFFMSLTDIEKLIALGALNTADQILSFFMVDITGNPRSGAAHYYKLYEYNNFILVVSIISLSVVISFVIMYLLSNKINKIVMDSVLKFLRILVIFSLIAIIYYLGGLYAILILITATSLGILSLILRVDRVSLTGSIILPVVFGFIF